jgi:hypothetical protein
MLSDGAFAAQAFTFLLLRHQHYIFCKEATMVGSFGRWLLPRRPDQPANHSIRPNPCLEVLEDRTVPSAPAMTTFVQTLYFDVLGRAPSTPESNYWGYIAGNYGTAAAVSGLLNSAESQNRIINNLYVEILGRSADAAGLQWWRGVLTGSGLEAVTVGILSSPEYVAREGNNLVTAQYQQLLGRTPSQAELSSWAPVFTHDGPTEVAEGIVQSPEYRGDFTQSLFIQDLHREGSGAELAYYANNRSMDLLQIEASILNSPEFLNQGS